VHRRPEYPADESSKLQTAQFHYGRAATEGRRFAEMQVADRRRRRAASVCRATSAMAPAISTPVAPPPTMTKVSRRRRSSPSEIS
jgi:hypothetical protein